MWAGFLAVIGVVWDAIQTVADYAILALTYAWQFLKAFAGDIWTAAKYVYTDILKPVGEFLHRAYDRLKAIYDKVVAPIERWARRITNAVRGVYNAYFRPILSAIDGVRRVLELLTLLHVQWASQLDKALADLEQKISAPVQEVIGVINHWVNRIESFVLTADNLFRRATLIGSIQRDLNSITNLSWNRSLRSVQHKYTVDDVKEEALMGADEFVQFFDAVADEDEEGTGVDFSAARDVFESMAGASTQ
jgi:phage-related protein